MDEGRVNLDEGSVTRFGDKYEHLNVFYDSQSAIYLAKEQVHHQRTKHIDVRYHFVREVLEEGEILRRKIRNQDNSADMLTKVVSGVKFNRCRDLIQISCLS